MEASAAVQIEFDSPAQEYIPWLQGVGPGCDHIIEQLRAGDTLAFAEVIQQYLFDNPLLGERLHDEVEEGLVDGTLLEDCELPPEDLEYFENFWNQPTVFIKFMDTMEEAGVDYSHGTVLRAEDLADYSQKIEEIAMSMKTLEDNVTTLVREVATIKTKVEAIERDMATKDWLNLRFGGLLVVAFLAGLGTLKWETLAGIFGH